MEGLRALTFVKMERPVRKYLSDEGQTLETKNKCNTETTTNNVPTKEDWEHKLVLDKYLETYKVYKDGIKAWAEIKGTYY